MNWSRRHREDEMMKGGQPFAPMIGKREIGRAFRLSRFHI